MMLNSITLGSLVSGPQLFGGVCSDSVELMAVEVSEGMVLFSGTFMGVNIGTFSSEVAGGELKTLEEV